MSYSYNQRKKNKKRDRTAEEKSVASRIRKGIIPAQFFTKTGDSKLERRPIKLSSYGRTVSKLTWNTKSTYKELTKKDKI